jgi:hypothetical protein
MKVGEHASCTCRRVVNREIAAQSTMVCVCVGWGAAVLTQVGVDLSRPGYMPVIAKATADIDVQIVFCNAGYILSGFFYSR